MSQMSPEYQAQYRAEHPDYVATQAKRQRARVRAVAALKGRYPNVWAELYRTELAKEGLE